jgi:hypothetical protein
MTCMYNVMVTNLVILYQLKLPINCNFISQCANLKLFLNYKTPRGNTVT